ncbi:hypothetical protein C1I89_07380 [Achromobacter pulmonis]|uniref:Uncharacterized protein n=1 Tax=Achromobacter pulmonis TaxID=1389932 RepID=A0A2N8KKS7_9BURK|nr:hypothetical protein C1I89_07380 [Achromobacter pulmonis]
MTIPPPSSKSRDARPFRNDRALPTPIPAAGPGNIVTLLAEWRNEEPLGPADQFPDLEDMPIGRQNPR